jgi:Fe(3+) dicitrate transport protein
MDFNKLYIPIKFFVLCSTVLHGQIPDSILKRELNAVTIQGYRVNVGEVKEMKAIQNSYISSGKKGDVIIVQDLPANLAEKTGRQIFAKVPGAFIYDMDGSGNQINVSTRGLDPHRGWEFNIRQNGIMTNTDIYGYPASHYSAPLEAISSIEIMRGTSSLLYGSQFGGMINYVTKKADTTKVFGFESQNTVGSYGLLSSYNAFGGKKGKFTYYGYYQRRLSNGYRENSNSDAQAQFLNVLYQPTANFRINFEFARSTYTYRMPGPLTDAMFLENPRQSTRQRNYYQPDIYIPSITFNWNITPNTKLSWANNITLGHRSVVQFIGFANVPDTINRATNQYNPRQVDIDYYNSKASELKLEHSFKFLKNVSTLIAGVRYVDNDLHRLQNGQGTTGIDFDLRVLNDQFGRDIYYRTSNIAIFAENLFKMTERWSISPGFRYEYGRTNLSGKIVYLPDEEIPLELNRNFPLFGVSSEYKFGKTHTIYGGWSQAYRPVILADVVPANNLERNDPNISDSYGHNAELGIKGYIKNRLRYDINYFQILYKNRVGTLALRDNNGDFFISRTNIGDTKTHGLELLLDYIIAESNRYKLSVFTASSYFNGFFLNGQIRDGNENRNLSGNKIESLPSWTTRNGLQLGYHRFGAVLQYSYVSETFSDPLNTVTPSANGARGIVPSYQIWDFNTSYRISEQFIIKFGINNIANNQYFTKRPNIYPGAGVWNSDGRSIVGTIVLKI